MLGRLAASVLTALTLSHAAYADLITFEEVPRHPANFEVRITTSGRLVFEGLLCDPTCRPVGIPVMDISELYGSIDLSASGPMGAVVSDGLRITAQGGQPFDFLSAYLGMTHPFDPRSITANGYSGGVLLHSMALNPNQSAQQVAFDWRGVDSVTFNARFLSGYLTIDDIDVRVSTVPAPGTAELVFAAAAGMLMARRRRRPRDARVLTE